MFLCKALLLSTVPSSAVQIYRNATWSLHLWTLRGQQGSVVPVWRDTGGTEPGATTGHTLKLREHIDSVTLLLHLLSWLGDTLMQALQCCKANITASPALRCDTAVTALPHNCHQLAKQPWQQGSGLSVYGMKVTRPDFQQQPPRLLL